MDHSGNTIGIFAKDDLTRWLQERIARIKSSIEDQSDDYILNVNETQYIEYLVGNAIIENLEIDFDDLSVSSYEGEFPYDPDSNGWSRIFGNKYKRDIMVYHLPYVGDQNLLYCVPNPRIYWSTEVKLSQDTISFEIINFQNDPQRIKQEAESIVNHIRKQYNYVRQQVEKYNTSLDNELRQIYQKRKNHLLEKYDLIASLGVPLRKKANLPKTFSIPSPDTRKRIEIVKPVVNEKGYIPEPSLEDSDYQEILLVVNDVGKQFERMPSTYKGKSEEDLRDHFLLFLEPRFSGSATGETFNKSGKTDILLRYEGENLFIGECKFWSGEKAYLKTIMQLQGYLTWRDSKAAIILFVRNKDFSAVIDKVIEITPRHPNFLKFIGRKDETWLEYHFHIDGDPNRELKLAILLFHIP